MSANAPRHLRHPRLRTRVAIIGAGPARLVLANVLTRAGVDCLVLESRSRAYLERRSRAGLLEHRTVRALRRHGLADRLLAEGTRHGWCEFRCLGRTVQVNYGAYAGGRQHWVYPQQLLVRDLIAALPTPPLFSHPVTELADLTTPRPVITCASGLSVEADYVIGCDGGRGISRTALPPGGIHVRRHRFPYDWLTVLAEVDRPPGGVVYGVHAEGFAGLMPRTAELARCYLQCAPDDTPERWPATRILDQLRTRLGDLPTIKSLPEVRVLRMLTTFTTPLQHGRLLLAGDAAHVLTPSGAKGMNLAIADALDLAAALLGERTVDGYTDRRLPEIHRTQAFSDRLLDLLHLPPDSATDSASATAAALRSRLATIERLARPGPHAAAFAHAYVGSR